ncbi:Hypp1179 [Branchiostoma lanceolatum]|uniref:Hypp1179 protein n=1 Tax=Branchiostoma lanceolatum TaxID=7740 RepID=A0A8K0EJ86_BRALA|nr:Hypp1179 [Branchiostoma lanceolatum]
MKRTGCWLLAVCCLLGTATAKRVHPFSPKCLLSPWKACVPDNIKLKWGLVDHLALNNGQEPKCSSFTFGLSIRPPFVVVTALENNWHTASHLYCEIKDGEVYDPSLTHVYSEIKDGEVYDPSLTHVYSEIKDGEVYDPSLTHVYSEIKDGEVYDPSLTHVYSEIKDGEVYDPSLTHVYSEIKDGEVYDPSFTHVYSEIKDGEVYDPSLTHVYSEIKDGEVTGLSVQNMTEDENSEQSKERQSGQCLEEDDVVRNDEQAEDPDDDVVTFYAAAAEVALSPSTKKRDTQLLQQYGTGPGENRSSHLTSYSAAKQPQEKKEE